MRKSENAAVAPHGSTNTLMAGSIALAVTVIAGLVCGLASHGPFVACSNPCSA